MITTENIEIGQVVKSLAGRDKGKILLVLNILDEEYVLVVDGDLRKIDNPKKKKVKHLMVYKKVLKEYTDKLEDNMEINNAYIRKLLEPFYNN